jgi:hypothetical protein
MNANTHTIMIFTNGTIISNAHQREKPALLAIGPKIRMASKKMMEMTIR